MAKQSETVHLFHMYRKDGTAVFLHPFRSTDKLHATLTKSEIKGHYGQEPRIESLTLFRNELYRQIEQEVKTWIADARFIPRFVISAIAFLVAFFLLSAVVNDPLIIVDEVVLSFGASVLTYILLGRRDMQSEAALKRRIELRNRVDAVVFQENGFVTSVEQFLNEREDRSPEELLSAISSGEALPISEDFKTESAQMLSYLDQLFSSSEYKQAQKRLKRLRKGGDERARESVGRWIRKQKVDVPLLSIYWGLKERVHSGR